MTIARAQQINFERTLCYHCVGRCVRRSFLCGLDDKTGKSFEHRRLWMVERMRLLSAAFCIDVAGYAIMSNHYHLVLHINLQAANDLTPAEVAERWQALFNGSKVVDRYLAGDESVAEIALATIAKWRKRLTSISWFMKCFNEHISRKANKEDGCKGHFWEGRFKSQPLLDEKALLAAMVYVDLNPIRAKMANSVTDSTYTSAYERIHGQACPTDAGPVLKPLMGFMQPDEPDLPNVLPCTYLAYMELLDWSSRISKPDKRGVVDAKQPPLLAQLDFDHSQWQTICTELGRFTNGALGNSEKLRQYYQARGSTRIPVNAATKQLFG